MSRPGNRSAVDRPSVTITELGTANVAEAFAAFSCGDADLDDFIRSDASRLHTLNVARTYVSWYQGAACGYVTLMADAVVLKPNERKKLRTPDGVALTFDDHPVIPALKIARLAVGRTTREAHRGMGEALVRFAFLTGLDVADLVGCRLLTLDAYPESIGFYEKLGFSLNRDDTYAARNHPSMRLDLFGPSPPIWV
jgi:ribosomal protein S18 acetylase RimI-like enzyme